MKNFLAFALTTILSFAPIYLLLASCSSPTSPSSGVVDTNGQPMPADAEEIIWLGSNNRVGDDGFDYFVIGFENRNNDYAVSGHIFRCEGFAGGSEGEVVYSVDILVPELLPGETRYIAQRLGNGTAPDSWRGSNIAENATWEKTNQQYVQTLEIINNKIEYPEHLTIVFSGEVVLCEGVDPAKVTDTVEIVVVFKSENGGIVFGISETINNFVAGETASYEITLENYIQYHYGNAKPEVYVYPI